jgi:hypothetical protein
LAEGNAIVCRASAGSIAPDGVRLDPNSGLGECLVSGRVVRCDDVDTDRVSICKPAVAWALIHAGRALSANKMLLAC